MIIIIKTNIKMFNYKTIKVQGDGECLFRCISIFMNKTLFNTNRDKNGAPISKNLKKKENTYSEQLRQLVCFRLESMKDMFKNEWDYDSEIYDNIDDRISKMSKKVEYAGMPELKCLSEMLNIVINIYVEIDINDNTTNKLVDYSSSEEDDSSNDTINIETDTILNRISTVGIYDSNKKICNLLLKNQHYCLIDFNDFNDFNDNTEFSNEKYLAKASFKKIDTVYGMVIKNNNFSEDDIKILECMCFNSNNKECGKKISNDSWFFWDNYDMLNSFAKKNNIELLK